MKSLVGRELGAAKKGILKKVVVWCLGNFV